MRVRAVETLLQVDLNLLLGLVWRTKVILNADPCPPNDSYSIRKLNCYTDPFRIGRYAVLMRFSVEVRAR
jgi:hypothetical protein